MKESFPENQEIKSAQEDRKEKNEIKGMVKLTLDGKEYEIETLSYNFEYPERIQKETGILGYERTKISANSLFEVIKNKASLILDELGIKTQEEFLKIYECYLGIRHDKKYVFTGYNKDRAKTEAGIDSDEYYKIEKIEKIILDINKKIINFLSDGEYPDFCYTHQIAAYYGSSNFFNQQFKEDKFFLQKIYSQERMQKNNTSYGFGNYGGSFSLYKEDGDILKKNYDMRDLINQDEIKENTAFAAMPNSGLNFWMCDFWNRDYQDIRSAAFGIPFCSDAFQDGYIKKSLEIFCKIEKVEMENLSKKEEISVNPANSRIFDHFKDFRGINGTIIMYALNEYIKNHPDYTIKYKESDPKFNFKNLAWEELFIKEFGDIVNNFLINHGIILEENSYNLKALLTMVRWGEVNLPVFINHKELPQVSWGYAKYAHYVNNQGLNFIKLKHADHLPEKNSMNF